MRNRGRLSNFYRGLQERTGVRGMVGRKSLDEKKSTILLDSLKRMAIFALFSYELGRQVKASIFSLKGMLAFFIVPYRGGTTTRTVVLSIS